MKDIAIKPLSPARMADYVRFFETRAFIDNADWSRCYCYFPYCDPATREWQTRTGAENRASICEMIQYGQAQGYLAYRGDEVLGWCNAAPFKSFPIMAGHAESDADRAGAIVCFVVCPQHRGQGIATALLDAACEGLRSQRFESVYARPFKGAKNSAENYTGPLSMYLAAGFTVVREEDSGTVLVRKSLM